MYQHKLNFQYVIIFLLCSIKVVPQIEHPVALCKGEELKPKTCFDVFYGDRAGVSRQRHKTAGVSRQVSFKSAEKNDNFFMTRKHLRKKK